MKFIKYIASALLCAIVTSGYSFPSGTYTNTFVRNGTIYVQRGQLRPSDYVVTNVNITAESIDALPLVEDSTGAKTAVTIGNRRSDVTVGPYSIANGFSVASSGYYSHAEGYSTQIGEDDLFAYAWNGDTRYVYSSHGKGTYNINPEGGLDGFYIGEKTLSEIFYTKAETDAKVNAIGDKADEAYSVAESLADGVNSLAGTIGTHTRDTKNPHKVTAAQVGAYTTAEVDAKIESAVVKDAENVVTGSFSIKRTYENHEQSLSFGENDPSGPSIVLNRLYSTAPDSFFSGSIALIPSSGEKTSLLSRIKEYSAAGWDARQEVESIVSSAMLPTDPTFSNAVLAVGLNIDTDSVAVLNEIASTFGGFPIEGTATTVGGLLAALAAAVAWLRRNKADKATTLAGYGITDAAAKTELDAKADKATPSASAALLSDNAVALVDGSAGGETSVSFKPPSGNALRYCELMLTGVASDGAATLVLPAGTYQFADGADSAPKGNSHFCFAEYARGRWLVTRQSTTEKAVEEAGA